MAPVAARNMGNFLPFRYFLGGWHPHLQAFRLKACKWGRHPAGRLTSLDYREIIRMNKIKINYQCRSWQGFVQQLVYLVSRGGYFYYCLVQYPLEKKEKWEKIDTKLIGKYQCDKSKYQRARNKNKGYIGNAGEKVYQKQRKVTLPIGL
jgi:hypothetical protein